MNDLFDIPADLDTPVSAYLKLAPFGRRFLLESVGGSGREARYSLLGFGQADECLLPSGLGADLPRAERQHALLEHLRTALGAAPRLTPRGAGSPFAGGLVGLSSYGLARALMGLPPQADEAPGALDYLGCAPHSILVFDHATRRMGLLSSGDQAHKEGLRREVMRALAGPLPKTPAGGGLGELKPSMQRGEFLARVERAQEAIRAGDIYQLVLSIRFQASCELEPISAYRALRLIDPSPYMFLMELGDTAVVGASPEALVRVESGQVFLQPIAGTRPHSPDPAEDARLERELLADPKEAAEHVMLVDLARNDMGRVARPGSISVAPYREVKRFRNVMHLVSGVCGALEPGRDAFDAFASAFPAGTVVGTPKTRAMQYIDELEPTPRGFYAGAVGSFGHGNSANQALAIRSASFSRGQVSLQAGAGIVMGSRPEAEYEEILSKTQALRAALELAQEGLQ